MEEGIENGPGAMGRFRAGALEKTSSGQGSKIAKGLQHLDPE